MTGTTQIPFAMNESGCMSDEDFKNLVSNKCPTSCRGLPALFLFADLLLLNPGNIVKGGVFTRLKIDLLL